MANTLDEFNAALAQLQATDDTLATSVASLATSAQKVDADITALQAQVAAGANPTDVSAQLALIQAENAKNIQIANAITTVTNTLNAADTNANPTTATTPPTTTPAQATDGVVAATV